MFPSAFEPASLLLSFIGVRKENPGLLSSGSLTMEIFVAMNLQKMFIQQQFTAIEDVNKTYFMFFMS